MAAIQAMKCASQGFLIYIQGYDKSSIRSETTAQIIFAALNSMKMSNHS
jgi:hypothetical protein